METTSKPRYNLWQNTAFMLREAWHTRKSVIFLCVALAAATAGQSVAELLIAPVILQKVEQAAALPELLGAILCLGGALALLAALKSYLSANAMFGRIDVRVALIRKINRKVAGTSYPNILDTAFLRMEKKAGDVCDNNDEASEHIWATWTDILANGLSFAVYLTVLTGLHPLLLAVVVATTAAGYLVNKRVSQWDYRHRDEKELYGKRLHYAYRTAINRAYAKEMRIFGLRPWLEGLWEKTMALSRAFLRRRERAYLWIHLVDLVLALLRNGIAYAYLLWLTLSRGMSASEFLLYFTAATGFTQWVTGLMERFAALHRESLDLSSLREFLEWHEPFCLEGGEPVRAEAGGHYEIRLENVSFRYAGAEKDALRDLSLTIRPGEKLAIVGLNGAGKTTLVKLVCGFLDPTRGRVLLNGRDIRELNRRDYYGLFSAVFQEFSLLEASVAENVAQRVDGIDEGRVWACLEQAGLTETVRTLPQGIHTHLGREVYEDGVELSGGQTQRLMLARALYKNGPILALDEPTAALDPLAESDIYHKYNEMTQGRTALLISHRLASTRFCDRILFLRDGMIAEEGTHQELLARGGGYAELFAVQSQYYREGGQQDEA